jgi:hypothetical protein
MSILGVGKRVTVHLQLQDEAEVSASVNPGHGEAGAFMVIYLGRSPNDVGVYMTLDAAGSLAEQILRELSNESMRAAKVAEEAAAT